MKRPSRRAILIAAVAAGTVAVLVTGAIVGLNVKADVDARTAYDDAAAQQAAATAARSAARRDLVLAQNAAAYTVNSARELATIEPTLLADAATIETLVAAAAELVTVAALIEGDGSVAAPPQPQSAPQAVDDDPVGRSALLDSAASMRTTTENVVAETATLTDDAEQIAIVATTVDAASAAVAASAFAAGSTAVAPAKASAETVAAFTAAVAALEAPAADADLTALVIGYRNAWFAAVASDAAARSGSGVTEPTYIRGILIVNKTYALPSTFGSGLTTETSNAFAAMQAAAAAAGHNIYISSGFRSFASQTSIYNRYKANEGQAGADTHSARPGHSEHQSGLAFDLNTITQAFGSTPEGIWTAQNAHLYGFIVRYPQGKESITGYIWEPWHLRYVGVDAATELYTSGQTLEEYLGVTSVYS